MRSPLFPILFILFFSFLATDLSAQKGNIESAEEAKILVAASQAAHAGQAREAVSLFQKLLKENALPKAYYLDYARVLQSVGMIDEALRWYRAYRDIYPGNKLAENGIFACEHISSFRRNPYSIRLYVLPRINSPGIERHPLYADGHLLFSREEGEERTWLEADPDIGSLPVETGMASLIPSVATDFDIESDTGSLVFAGEKDKNGSWQLYFKSSIVPGAEKEVRLPFCSADFNTRYPAWSPGRQYLFFSSNRPGGFGGMDIWFLPRDSLFSASPRNAGPLVNTAADELAPAFSPSGALVFSSNGHPGLGGFDLFEIKMDDSARFAGSVVHLGSPLNSGYDELRMTWVSAGRGFLLSSRPGGQGLQDIFEWRSASDFLRFEVFDSTGRQPLSGVSFYSLGEGGTMEFLGVSDAQGQISFLTKEKKRDGFRLEKAGYESRLIAGPEHKFRKGAPAIRVSLRREIEVRIAGVVKNKADGSLMAGVEVRCAGPGSDSLLLTTDSSGRFFLEANPGEHWVFDVHRNAYLPAHEELFTGADKKHALYKVTLWLNPLIQGKPIVLEEILFKYKSTEIDEEASRDLKKLLDMLIENPDLLVEISTHTDSRGGYQYNEILSQKRAQAVVDWLVTRGVAPSRLVARGYGEYRLVNECADSVPCPEWKHRQNRRAEVKILGNRDTLKGLITAADHHWDIDPQEIPVYVPDSLKHKRQEHVKNKSNVAKDEKSRTVSPNKEEPLPATGEVYVVQFAASTRAGDRFPAAERMGPLIKEKFGRFTRFMIGPLPTLDEAYQLRDRLREKGFRDAFIVAYRDGKRLSIRY